MGPEIEYAEQDPAGPVELRIYAGADGDFNLYQDAGDGYAYEKGERALIPMHWDDRTSSLTIGERQGSYPGMPPKMDFHVVLVAKGHGAGEAVTARANRTISYDGKETTVEVRR
jgi:alpha-D-xyloside xylohydrolase